MATSRYETQLLALLKDSLIANSKADRYIKDIDKRWDLIGKIAIEITQMFHISISDAQAYIDIKTGRFKPGRKLIVCPSDKIKGLYNQLEAVTTEINSFPWRTKEQALTEVADKQNKVKATLDLIKAELGVAGAKEVLHRTMETARRLTGVK